MTRYVQTTRAIIMSLGCTPHVDDRGLSFPVFNENVLPVRDEIGKWFDWPAAPGVTKYDGIPK